MLTEHNSKQLEFEAFGKRKVVAAFDGGDITFDAGALLLREADIAIGMSDQVAACFTDGRNQDSVVHLIKTLVGQRIHAFAPGYEGLNDHDDLRHDGALGLLSDTLQPKRKNCAVPAGKSTLNRLECSACAATLPVLQL